MSRLWPALVLVLILGMSLFSQTSSASEKESEISFSTTPQVAINVTNSVNVNVSYWAVILSTPEGSVGSLFSDHNWTLTNNSSGFSYRSSFSLVPLGEIDLGGFYSKYVNSSGEFSKKSDNVSTIPVQAYVNISRYDGMVKNLSIHNSSVKPFNFNGVNNSTLKMSFSLAFNLPVGLSGGNSTLILVQSLKASENAQLLQYNRVNATDENATIFGGIAMAVPNQINDTKALYWWNDGFLYNGHNRESNVSTVSPEENHYVLFFFSFPSMAGQVIISQDPYLSVNGTNLIGSKIIVYGESVINYLLQHIEFTVGGFVIGSALMAGMYVRHRRRRIRI